MLIRILTVFALLIVLLHPTSAQDFRKKFQDLGAKNDTLGQRKLLAKWEKAKSNDPELYVAYFNYYASKSQHELLRLDGNPDGNPGFAIMELDSTKKEPAAYLYGDTYYDKALLQKGFDYIDKGIEKHPTRLDMRFGKIYMYGKTEDYEHFTTEIIKTIDYSAVIDNKWTWTDGKPQEDPKEFMLGGIQEYQNQLFNTNQDSLLGNMKRIAETVLKYYPNHIESLSNISIVYMIQKQYDMALAALLKAEKINPQDFIVLNNIAQCYKLSGDKPNAIKYYELTMQHGDKRAQKHAQEEIEQLKK